MSDTRKWVDYLWELECITAIFPWIFHFLSRVAEPLMTLAVIYTIIVAGIPHAYQPALYNTAIAAMIGSPESILPGAFILMCARCVAGVSYSIIIRIVHHQRSSEPTRLREAFDTQQFMRLESPLYGYKWNTAHTVLEPYELEAGLVRFLFEEYPK